MTLRATIDWTRPPTERERHALDILPRSGQTIDGIEWLVFLALQETLDTVGYMIARGWVLFTATGAGSRVALSQRGMDVLLPAGQ